MDREPSRQIVGVEPSHTTPPVDVGPRESGEAPSFPALFEAHFEYCWNTLRRLGVRPVDLEDLTHETFLQVFRQFAHYDPHRPVKPWLFGFAFRMASDYRRKARNRPEVLGHPGEPADQGPDAVEQLLQRERLELAREALDAIELSRRAVFILHELDSCTIPEVSASLGIPLATAYSRLRLAREDFAAAAQRLRLRRGDR